MLTFVIILSSIIIVVYLYFHFSGTPLKNVTYATKLRRVSINYLIWTICCIIRSSMSLSKIIPLNNDEFLADTKTAFIIFFENLITEVIPYVLSLEHSFV